MPSRKTRGQRRRQGFVVTGRYLHSCCKALQLVGRDRGEGLSRHSFGLQSGPFGRWLALWLCLGWCGRSQRACRVYDDNFPRLKVKAWPHKKAQE